MHGEIVYEYRMKSVEGQQRVRKDAIFQASSDPQGISTREYNGQCRLIMCIVPDKAVYFTQDAMVDACGETGQRIGTQGARVWSGIHHGEACAIGVQGFGAHVHTG